MSSDMKELKASVAEAKKWCQKARDILKIKRKRRLDKKMQGYAEMDHAIDAVIKGLGKLQKKKTDREKYETLARSFSELTNEAKLAVESGSETFARMLSDQLQHLENRIKNANGDLNDEDLQRSGESLQRKEQGYFESAREDANKLYEDLQSKARDRHSFEGDVPMYLYKANAAVNRKGHYILGMSQLANIKPEYDVQVQRHAKLLEYDRKLATSQQRAGEVSLLKSQDNPDPAQPIIDRIEEATALCERSDYPAACEKLDAAITEYKNAVKGAGKTQISALKDVLKAKKSFDDLYRKTSDQIAKVLKIRGADAEGSDVKVEIDLANETLHTAFLLVNKSISPEFIDESTAATIDLATESLGEVPDLLKRAIEASKAEKKSSEEDFKAIKRWKVLQPEAKNAYQFVVSLPGADDQASELFKLLGEAEVKRQSAGYAAAVELLEGYKPIADRARTTSENVFSLGLPVALQAAADKALRAIYAFSDIGPSHATEMFIEDLTQLVGSVKLDLSKWSEPTDFDSATDRGAETLKTFEDSVVEAIEKAKQEQEEAQQQLDEFNTEQQNLVDANVADSLYVDMQRIAHRAESVSMVDREWAHARDQLKTAIVGLKQADKDYEKWGVAWKQKQEVLSEAKELNYRVIKWPPLASTANSLLEKVLVVEKLFAETNDYDACLKEFADLKIEEHLDKLRTLATTAPAPEDLDTFRENLSQATKQINDACDALRTGGFWKLESRLGGLAEPMGTSLHQTFDEALKTWETYREQPTSADIQELHRQRDAVLSEIEKVSRQVIALLKDKKALGIFSVEAKEAEEKRFGGKRVDRIEALIDRLDKFGVDTKIERRDLPIIVQNPTQLDESDFKKVLVTFEDDLAVKLNKASEDFVLQFTAAAEKLEKDVAKPLGKIKCKEFEGYKTRLENEVTDIQEMLMTRDPELLLAAQRAMDDLLSRVKSIDPKQRADDDITFDQVEKTWGELSSTLGTKAGTLKGPIVEMRLPSTYASLRSNLNDAIKLASKSSPEVGLTALLKLKQPIDDALVRARTVDDEFALFTNRKSAIVNRWKEVRKVTSTQVTDRTKEVNAYFAARVNEAEGAAASENGLGTANKLLDAMDKMCDDVLGADDPRQKLQEFNGVFAQQQRDVRDMAREFQAELKTFIDVTLPATIEVVKTQEDGDVAIAKNLKKVAKTAAKLVEPYLFTLSMSPKKSLKANNAPQLDQAIRDFQSARGMLNDAEKTAFRLKNATSSTNVTIVEDFRKVEQHWVAQVRGYASSLRSMAVRIRSIPAEIRKEQSEAQPNEEGLLGDDALSKLADSAEKGAKFVDDMVGRFRSDAFGKSFALLGDDSKVKKEDKKTRHNARLAAREDVLRLMREYRNDLVKHPLLRKLTDESNPLEVERRQLMAASGYLRASLKRIEIETLIGV